ncbi:MAG TPA: amidase, partial [Spirochaetota bacterium]|nr:amidase [Spirochaetota bacterium]
MAFNEYEHYDAIGLAELIKKRKVSVREVINEAIQRIQKINPVINAVITPMYENIDARIKDMPKGRFYGVPFFIKD